jgi:hypothetical protein
MINTTEDFVKSGHATTAFTRGVNDFKDGNDTCPFHISSKAYHDWWAGYSMMKNERAS